MSDSLVTKALRRLRPRQADDAAPWWPAEELERVGPEDRPIIERALHDTMTGVPRLQALVDAVRYCVAREVPGDFVECGVWRGGSVLAMILTLQEVGAERDVYLYDTFEGMTAPTEHDTSQVDRSGMQYWEEAEREGTRAFPHFFESDVFNEDAVRDVVTSSGYPGERLHFVRGPVEETLPGRMPDRVALLRLDTDWYESTRHELVHLYPRLEAGGVLILDDYGHWDGARRAVDEYFAREAPPLLLNRIDYAGRVAIKS